MTPQTETHLDTIKPNIMASWYFNRQPTSFEYNTLCLIAKSLQREMTMKQELVNNCKITEIPIPFNDLKHISKEECQQRLEIMRKELLVHFRAKDPKTNIDKDYKLSVITGETYDPKTGRLTGVIINESFRPWLLNLSRGYYNTRTNVSLTLPSTFAKRLYDYLCCQGGYPNGISEWYISEFVKLFNLNPDTKQLVFMQNLKKTVSSINESNKNLHITSVVTEARGPKDPTKKRQPHNYLKIFYTFTNPATIEKQKKQYDDNTKTIARALLVCDVKMDSLGNIIHRLSELNGAVSFFAGKCEYYLAQYGKNKLTERQFRQTLTKILSEEYKLYI